MNYKILKTLIEFENDNLKAVTVLIDAGNGFEKAYRSESRLMSGYFSISPKTALTDDLFQKVAGYGFKVDTKKYFKK